MKRFTLVASLAIVLFTSNAFSQIQAIGVGGGVVLPTGSFGDFAGTGFGGNVQGYYKYEGLDNVVLTGYIGYYRFGEKEFSFFGTGTGIGYKWTLIPIMSGGRYYLGEPEAKTRLFLGAEVGVHIYSLSVSDEDTGLGSGALAGSTEFAIIPVVGAQLGPLDLYAQYSLSDLNYIGLKGMFRFAVGNK